MKSFFFHDLTFFQGTLWIANLKSYVAEGYHHWLQSTHLLYNRICTEFYTSFSHTRRASGKIRDLRTISTDTSTHVLTTRSHFILGGIVLSLTLKKNNINKKFLFFWRCKWNLVKYLECTMNPWSESVWNFHAAHRKR